MREEEKQEFLTEIYRDHIIGQIQDGVYDFKQTLVNSRLRPLTPEQTYMLIGKLSYDGWTYLNHYSKGFISLQRGFHADKFLAIRKCEYPDGGYMLNVFRR